MADENPEGTSNPPAPSPADETATWTPPPPPAPPAGQAAPYPPPPPPPPAPPPYEPPAYSPPPAASPVFSPPPAAAPTEVPPAYQQQFGAPYAPYSPPPQQAAPRRGRGRMFLILGIIAVVVLAALGGGGVLANASLSTTYSPQNAVKDYFAAMGKGDVKGMMSNATFLTGDSAYSDFFGKDAVTAMMAADENKQITDVKVGTVSKVDDSTSSVAVSLSWGGRAHNLTYNVRKDTSRTHYLFYPSWRMEVPFTTITLTLPNQAGAVQVDGVALPSGAGNKAEVIQGFHKVTMQASDFYDADTQTADSVESSAAVSFPGGLSSAAKSAAADSVKAAFNNVTCDASKYFDCPNHAYKVPAGYYDVLPAAGGDIRANSSWSLAFEGDPTASEQFTVTTTSGEVDGSGACGMKLTVDGNKVYHFKGTWTAKLTWQGSGFSSDVTIDCDSSRV